MCILLSLAVFRAITNAHVLCLLLDPVVKVLCNEAFHNPLSGPQTADDFDHLGLIFQQAHSVEKGALFTLEEGISEEFWEVLDEC